MAGCPECGAENRDGSRFCSTCGASLLTERARVSRSVRKAVTILFSDVSGFTPLTASVDAERLGRVMKRYVGTMQAVIERHGGSVEKFIGDAIMAVFGIPRMHEDDALRAVRAAIGMRDALDVLNLELEREWGISLEVHTGINTGEVATDESRGRGGVLLLGDAVNVAARLQQAAGRREILLGPSTQRLVEGAVESELLGPIALKGKSEPIEVFRLLGMRAAHAAATRRMDTPLVGRQDDYATIVAAFERAVASRSCQMVLVTGIAGVGKTRLVTEFVRTAQADATVVQGHCPSYGEGITFWPLGEVIRQTAGITAEDALPDARDKLAAVVAGEADADAIVEDLGHLLGLTQTTVGPEVLFWGVRRALEAVARRRPLVAVFEDIHWAQPTFLELLGYIAEWTRDAPILLCCTARPEFSEANPDCGESGIVSRIDLSPLSQADSAALVGILLESDTAPERAWNRLIEAAQGNPLYLQEMVSMLIDDRLIRRTTAGWVPSVPLQDVTLPLTLQSLLVSRVDALETGDRQVIDVAAVMGTEFDRRPLLPLGAADNEQQLREALDRLIAKGFLRTTTTGEEGLAFEHALVREATYNSMSKEARARLHEQFADWLERTPQTERAGESEEVLGYHLERAHQLGAELHPHDQHSRRLADRAGGYLARAGRKAFSRGDMVAAANLLSRAVNLLGPDDPIRLAELPTLSEALMMTGDLERAGATLDQALAEATERGERAVLAHVVLVQTTQRLFTQPEGWVEAARREVERAIPVFEELDDHLGLAHSWRLLSLIELSACRYAATGEAMDRSAHYARLAGDRRQELESLSWLPLPLFAGPTPVPEGIRQCQEILDRAEGDRKVEGTVLLIRAALEAMADDVDAARMTLGAAKEAFADLGLQFWIAGPAAQFGGWVELTAGDPVAAERELRPGYEALRQMGESSWLTTVTAFLARSMFAQERYEEAEEFARMTIETADSQDVYSQVVGRGVKARTLCVRGSVAEARALAEEAVQLAAGTDCLQLQADALMDLAEILRSQNQFEEAVRAAGEALRLHERKGNMPAARAARGQLGTLSSAAAP